MKGRESREGGRKEGRCRDRSLPLPDFIFTRRMEVRKKREVHAYMRFGYGETAISGAYKLLSSPSLNKNTIYRKYSFSGTKECYVMFVCFYFYRVIGRAPGGTRNTSSRK